ncbi:MAG: polysaccharide biosynthesis/export family protein [Akkermansiaceae bacterium]
MKSLFILMLAVFAFAHANAQIRVNQTLQISIQGVPATEQSRLNSTYQVSSSGSITMWEIGAIRASGLTAGELAARIAEEYKRRGIYTNPNFQVILPSDSQLVTKTFVVGGAVRSSGQRPFTDGLTLFGAVQAAGGETEFGAVTRIKLYRNGKMQTLNLKNDVDKNFRIRPDDMIEVPQKNWIGQ